MKPQPALEQRSAAPPAPKPAQPKAVARRREHMFHVGMAVAIVITIVAGFVPTYYLRPVFTSTPLPLLVHIHGALMTAWLALVVVQPVLVATNRTHVHRRVGYAGAGLAASIVLLGTITAIVAASRGSAPDGVDPLVFMTVPLADMIVFPILVGAGVRFRKRADTHKRLMLIATIAITGAGIARLPVLSELGPLGFFVPTDVFLAACVVYDLVTLRRVHRATMWAGILVVVSQPLRLVVGSTSAWMAFAGWLTDLVR